MTFRNLCILATAVSAVFGFAFLLAPDFTSSFYGISGWNAGTLVPARLYGVGLLFVAACAFAMHDSGDAKLVHRACAALAAGSLAGAVVSLHSVLTGSTNALMWTTVALYAFFAVCWGMVAMRDAAPSSAQAA